LECGRVREAWRRRWGWDLSPRDAQLETLSNKVLFLEKLSYHVMTLVF